MKLTKIVLLASSVFVLAACGDKGETAECKAYVETINSCVAKVTTANAEAGAALKKNFEAQNKALFESEQFKNFDSKTQAQSCKALDDAIKQSAAAMGC